jgi:hypothetical protein
MTDTALSEDTGTDGLDAVARTVLSQQVRALFDDVDEAEMALTAVPAGAELRARVEVNYQQTLDNRRASCLELARRLASGAPLADCWETFRGLREATKADVVESFSFIQGALAREHGLAVEVTQLADALVKDLVRRLPVDWARFTLIAEREFLGGPAEIIRLRFPETTIWSLPLVAHELGHFAGPRLGHEDSDGRHALPFNEMLKRAARDGPGAQGRLDELFADVFATWMVGPAFAHACLFLRFDPSRGSDSPFARHPDDAERMLVIVQTLRAGVPLWPAEVVDDIERHWAHLAAAPGANLRPRAASAGKQLARQADELIALLERELGPKSAYRGWPQVEGLAEKLAAGRVPRTPPNGTGPWDVINAAWLHRSRAPLESDRSLEALAAKLCHLCRQAVTSP